MPDELENGTTKVGDGDEVRRPGPHGAFARNAAEEEIAKAYRRAERNTRKAFQAVTPRSVTAAEAVTSISHDDEETLRAVRPNGRQSRACFIATAAYGDSNCADVERLRGFRDRKLLTNSVGRGVVRAYYRVSPPFARMIARKPRLRLAVRRVFQLLQTNAAL